MHVLLGAGEAAQSACWLGVRANGTSVPTGTLSLPRTVGGLLDLAERHLEGRVQPLKDLPAPDKVSRVHHADACA